MKLWQLQPFYRIFDIYLPKNICEIGTHHGRTACQFIEYLAPKVNRLHYTGYDLFEDADSDITRYDHNGKGPGSHARAQRSINKIRAAFNHVTVRLIQGNTLHTLQPQIFDFVYVDGGHSYQTVMHDFAMIRGSKAVVFDDYQIPAVKQAVDEIAAGSKDYTSMMMPSHALRPKRQQIAMFWQIDSAMGTSLHRAIHAQLKI